MSCNSCEKKSNNGENGMPCFNRMAYSQWTHYEPRCVQNQMNRQVNNFKSSYEYRQWLINNAEQIMDDERQVMRGSHECKPCFDYPNEKGTLLDEKRMLSCDNKICSYKAIPDVDNMAQGDGRAATYSSAKFERGSFYPITGFSDNDNGFMYGKAL
jgi:hypothetical protein